MTAFAPPLMMGAVSLAAVMLLRHVRADLAGGSRGPGLVRRAGSVALGMGMHAAVGAAGSAGVKGARGLGRRLGLGAGAPPWERLDDAGGDARAVHGDPQPGFDPVPDLGDGGDSGGGDGGASGVGGPPPGGGGGPGGGGSGGGGSGGGSEFGGGASDPAGAPVMDPIADQPVGGSKPPQSGRRPSRSDRARAGAAHVADSHPGEPDPEVGTTPHPPAAEAPTAPPITEPPDSGDPGPVPPPEPPPDEQEPPPDDEPAPPEEL